VTNAGSGYGGLPEGRRLDPPESKLLQPGTGLPHETRMKEAEANSIGQEFAAQFHIVLYQRLFAEPEPGGHRPDHRPARVWRRILAPTPSGIRLPDRSGRCSGAVPWNTGKCHGRPFCPSRRVHFFSRRLSFIRNCERCGKLICSRCARSRSWNQCVQCLNAFTVRPSADPR